MLPPCAKGQLLAASSVFKFGFCAIARNSAPANQLAYQRNESWEAL